MQLTFVAQVQESTTKAFSTLIDSGVLGAVTVIAIIGFGLAVVLLLKEKDKRIEDASKTRDNVGQPLRAMQESLERIETKIIVSKARNNDEGY